MNFLTWKTTIRHSVIKSKSLITSTLVSQPITARWTLTKKKNKNFTDYLDYILFSYYYWNIMPIFTSNSKQIYISKLKFNIQPVYLINMKPTNIIFSLFNWNNQYNHQFQNLNINFNNEFWTYTFLKKKTVINNKLNFELNLNSKFNLFGLFWFQFNNKLKSKFLFSKLNWF